MTIESEWSVLNFIERAEVLVKFQFSVLWHRNVWTWNGSNICTIAKIKKYTRRLGVCVDTWAKK